MSQTPSNFAASVRARLLNLAKVQGVEFNQILVRFTLERFLYRLSLSQHADDQLIDLTTATRNPLDTKHGRVEDDDWETCTSVLKKISMRELLSKTS